MTYCVGMRLKNGLVFMSDTRTNAGIDNISVFRKLFTWQRPGERFIVILTAGNLATTQALIGTLDERTKVPEDRKPSILEAPTMFQVAHLVGDALKEVIQGVATSGLEADSKFNATVIVGGQIKGTEPRLFMVYPEGNFVETSEDTSFFQIGETKYGRPILVRAFDRDMSFEDAIKLLLVSFDSTIKANLSVGLPLDLLVYKNDKFEVFDERRIEIDDEYYTTISNSWGDALRTAFQSLRDFRFK